MWFHRIHVSDTEKTECLVVKMEISNMPRRDLRRNSRRAITHASSLQKSLAFCTSPNSRRCASVKFCANISLSSLIKVAWSTVRHPTFACRMRSKEGASTIRIKLIVSVYYYNSIDHAIRNKTMLQVENL